MNAHQQDSSAEGITRRDFINGVAVAIGGGAGTVSAGTLASNGVAPAGPASGGEAYLGQSLATAAPFHALHAGAPRPPTPRWRRGDESVDLVVVGAGISGLSAAWLYARYAPRGARVLVLEAAPDLGGHAVRNEFVSASGRRLLGYGGSEALDSPSLWSEAASTLVRDVGIDLEQFKSYHDGHWRQRHGLVQRATYFDPAVWGRGGLVVRNSSEKTGWIEDTPLEPAARVDLARLLAAPPDPWPGLGRRERRERLARITYDGFLTNVLGLSPQLRLYFRNRTQAYLGAGTDAASALDAYALGLPGFAAMSLGNAADPAMSPSARQSIAGRDDYIYHFPDGNTGLVRALLRALIPAALPGSGHESLLLAQREDARLDVPGMPVRIRLSAPVLHVGHAGVPGSASAVDVAYDAGTSGGVRVVRARHVVLACFHRVIPHICPELGATQREALHDQVRVPLVYANLLLSNWRPFASAGISGFDLPGGFWSGMKLDMPVSIGRYRFPDSPDQPIVLHMGAVVLGGDAGATPREQAAAGRRHLLGLPFGELEAGIRRTLAGALGGYGFDPARDIEAITLNRWAHGYAYEYMRPWDAYWPTGPLPCRTARRRFGRIAIACSDAGAFAYAHGAIDQATRAVGELLPNARLPRVAGEPGPPRSLLTFER